MKNKLTDLNDHLFAELERLSDESLDPESIKTEIARAGAVASVADKVIQTGRLALDAQKAAYDFSGPGYCPPSVLGLDRITEKTED